MRLNARIQKLEKRYNKNGKLWALFSIHYYENATDREKVQSMLISDYLSNGYAIPDYKIFIQTASKKQN